MRGRDCGEALTGRGGIHERNGWPGSQHSRKVARLRGLMSPARAGVRYKQSHG